MKLQQPAISILLHYLFHSTPPFILQKTKQNKTVQLRAGTVTACATTTTTTTVFRPLLLDFCL